MGDRAEDLPVAAGAPEWSDRRAPHGAIGALLGRGDVLLVIAAGGALGSLARWAIGVWVPHGREGFPWATWLENVTGAFALGVLMVFVVDVWPPSRYLRPFWAVGVLGGYTTFSTYMLDARALLAAGRAALAAGYLAGTLVVGLAAVWLGVLAARTAVAAVERRHRRRRSRPSRPTIPNRAPPAGRGAADVRDPDRAGPEGDRPDPDTSQP